MLNKEERRWMETYVLPLLDKVLDLSDLNNDITQIYSESYIDSKSNGKNGLWVAFSKINEDINEVKEHIKRILKDKFVEKQTLDQKLNNIENKYKKEKELREIQNKNKEKLLKEYKKEVLVKFVEKTSPKIINIINKKLLESLKEGIRSGKLSDKEILNLAEKIKLEQQLGIKGNVDVKK